MHIICNYIPLSTYDTIILINKFVNFNIIIIFATGMEIIFAKNYLKELYLEGMNHERRYRFQKDIIRRYQKVIDRMAAARRPEDLMRINSLRYEKLKGNKNGISSVRVSDKYRIEFEEMKIRGEEAIVIFNILELSNHYE